jgi:hypothetical protein
MNREDRRVHTKCLVVVYIICVSLDVDTGVQMNTSFCFVKEDR